jgi:hypothetical protein
MHPDEAVDLAIQDLRAIGAAHPVPMRSGSPFHLLARGLWRRYLDAWTWYVRDGRTPPADSAEVGHLARAGIVPARAPRVTPQVARDCPPLACAGAVCG